MGGVVRDGDGRRVEEEKSLRRLLEEVCFKRRFDVMVAEKQELMAAVAAMLGGEGEGGDENREEGELERLLGGVDEL